MEISQESLAAEVFKALGDPVRWSIITQIGAVDELPCAELEQTLPVSKPTIAYHTKILQQAGLLTVRKQGRNYFYALRRDVLAGVQEALWRLAAVPAAEGEHRARPTDAGERPLRRAADDDETVLLTW